MKYHNFRENFFAIIWKFISYRYSNDLFSVNYSNLHFFLIFRYLFAVTTHALYIQHFNNNEDNSVLSEK